MKKISLQTKLEDCFVPKRFIDVIRRGAEDIRTIFDLVSLSRREFMRISYVGLICFRTWRDFLKQYDLYIGMWLWEILQYEPNLIVQYYLENGKLHSKLISSLNCDPESNIDREQREKFDPKTLKPFDKVLKKCTGIEDWECDFFSHIDDGGGNYPYITITTANKLCIPYNDDTKHLAGTTEEAPEFYRYWED